MQVTVKGISLEIPGIVFDLLATEAGSPSVSMKIDEIFNQHPFLLTLISRALVESKIAGMEEAREVAKNYGGTGVPDSINKLIALTKAERRTYREDEVDK